MSAAKTTIVAVLVLMLTFASGVIAGLGAARMGFFMRGPRGHMPPLAAHMILRHMDRELDLSDAQEVKIRAIFERRYEHMRAEVASTNAEIESVLTPEQKKKFATMRMHMAGRRRR